MRESSASWMGGKESRKMTKVFRIKNSEELGADCRCTAECMNYEWGDWRVCNFFQWFFFAKLMQIRIRRKRRDAPSPAKICFTSSCPPSSHQNALSRALKLKLQTASWSVGRPSTHHTPSTCYQTRYVLPYIYKMANDEADQDIDDCFLVPCSLCKGLVSFTNPPLFLKSGRHHMSTVEMR